MAVKVINNAQQFLGIATPAADPPPGYFFGYFKTDGNLDENQN